MSQITINPVDSIREIMRHGSARAPMPKAERPSKDADLAYSLFVDELLWGYMLPADGRETSVDGDLYRPMVPGWLGLATPHHPHWLKAPWGLLSHSSLGTYDARAGGSRDKGLYFGIVLVPTRNSAFLVLSLGCKTIEGRKAEDKKLRNKIRSLLSLPEYSMEPLDIREGSVQGRRELRDGTLFHRGFEVDLSNSEGIPKPGLEPLNRQIFDDSLLALSDSFQIVMESGLLHKQAIPLSDLPTIRSGIPRSGFIFLRHSEQRAQGKTESPGTSWSSLDNDLLKPLDRLAQQIQTDVAIVDPKAAKAMIWLRDPKNLSITFQRAHGRREEPRSGAALRFALDSSGIDITMTMSDASDAQLRAFQSRVGNQAPDFWEQIGPLSKDFEFVDQHTGRSKLVTNVETFREWAFCSRPTLRQHIPGTRETVHSQSLFLELSRKYTALAVLASEAWKHEEDFMPPHIFVSYRRNNDCSHDQISEVYELLVEEFPQAKVVIDREFPKAEDWTRTIDDSIVAAHVVVAVFGPNWAEILMERDAEYPDLVNEPPTSADTSVGGPSRDWTRYELALALKHERKIVPLLVGDGRAPTSKLVKGNIAEIVHKHNSRFPEEQQEFLDTVRRHLPPE